MENRDCQKEQTNADRKCQSYDDPNHLRFSISHRSTHIGRRPWTVIPPPHPAQAHSSARTNDTKLRWRFCRTTVPVTGAVFFNPAGVADRSRHWRLWPSRCWDSERWIAVIQPDSMVDDLGGKAMAIARVGRGFHPVSLTGMQPTPRPGDRDNARGSSGASHDPFDPAGHYFHHRR